MFDEILKIKGHLKIINTKTKEVLVDKDNLITDAGKEQLLDLMCGIDINNFNKIAVGSDNTAPTVLDTALGVELDRVNVVATRTTKQVLYKAVFIAGVATGTWREAGVFNNAVGGDMLSRVTFSDVNKSAGDVYSVQWIFKYVQ